MSQVGYPSRSGGSIEGQKNEPAELTGSVRKKEERGNTLFMGLDAEPPKLVRTGMKKGEVGSLPLDQHYCPSLSLPAIAFRQ